MKLYQANLSPFASSVRLVARVKGIDDQIEMLTAPGGAGSDAFRAINPTAKIPTLEVDGMILAESATICEYLEDRFPQPAMLPADPMARAQTRLLMRAVDLYVFGPMFRTLPHLATKNFDRIGECAEEMIKGLGYVESYRNKSGYAGAKYAIGDSLTLADGPLTGVLFWVNNFAVPTFRLDYKLPDGLAAYEAAIREEPHCKQIMEEMGTALRAMSG